jgi:glyoxylase-like metal-dependent hydrolase (beta-lactamase superfamily II)
LNQPDFQFASNHFAIWHAFDPSVKADLFSTAVATAKGTILVDPIKPSSDDLSQLQARAPITGIVITSQNHWRASNQLSHQLSVPIFAHATAELENVSSSFVPVANIDRLESGLEIIAIEGAAPGEIAIWYEPDGGTLIVGDALINVEPYGFTLLPPKYCADHRKMRRSLRQLADRKLKRIFFAHGLPIISGAVPRFRALLDSE